MAAGQAAWAGVLAIFAAGMASCHMLSRDSAAAGAGADATPATVELPLRGDYLATFKAPLVGEVSGRLAAKPTRNGFTAATHPDVAWDMIGGIEGLFGSIFAGHLFPGGSILTWKSGLPRDGLPAEGILGAGIKSAQVRTRLSAPDEPIELYTPDGRRVATMTLRAAAVDEPPMADYSALAAGVERAFADRLYDSSLLRSGQVRGYYRQLRANAAASHDDVEFIFGAVVAGRNNVKFALPLVFKRLDPDWRAQLGGLKDAGMATLKVTYDQPSGIATLKVEAFVEADDVDRAMEQVLSYQPHGVLLDIRGCPGVTLASLRLASWFVAEPVEAGAFFGPAAREGAMAGRVDELPRLELSSAESVEAIERLLDEGGGARITVMPTKRHFAGPVALLTTARTTTSAEPLAWTLKGSGRARLFGQATAGKPTLSRPVDIGQGWVVWVPALDYRPPSGERTDRGCRPDFESSSKDKAAQAARQWLMQQAGS